MKQKSKNTVIKFQTQTDEHPDDACAVADIFRSLDRDSDGLVTNAEVLSALSHHGILESDPRYIALEIKLSDAGENDCLTLSQFTEAVRGDFSLVKRAARELFVIPKFSVFAKEAGDIFNAAAKDRSGTVATYIPQLAAVDPESFAVSICTVDGQRANFGNSDTPFSVQSASKLISYAAALELNGEEKVHRHVGREPSGKSFNELSLNPNGLPHNPLLNAGGIMSAALIKPKLPAAKRFEHILDTWKRLTGGCAPGYSNSIYQSEKITADRNFALTYFMKEMKAFPKNTDILETLDFYFQCCSVTQSTDQLAVAAATFANAGVCPLTADRVFASDTTKNSLSLMYSCGMYDFSGEFAFAIGLPAKSGVSGIMLVVVPNVMGIGIWSPRLDKLGNSVRGIRFCRELVKRFKFHNYDNISGDDRKIDPTLRAGDNKDVMVFKLINAASQGDMNEILRLVAHGIDLNAGDYDYRTPLHLAASEGRLDVVRYLLSQGVDSNPKDRWGFTPAEDASRHGHADVAALFSERAA